jgi:hypothetical protein
MSGSNGHDNDDGPEDIDLEMLLLGAHVIEQEDGSTPVAILAEAVRKLAAAVTYYREETARLRDVIEYATGAEGVDIEKAWQHDRGTYWPAKRAT